MSDNNSYDVIIIGAGVSGLTAGAVLCKQNKKVLILEKNNYDGGSLTSFKRGRFEFDASLKELQGFNPNYSNSDISKVFEYLGIKDKINWHQTPNSFRILSKTHAGVDIDVILPKSVPAYIDKLASIEPESRKPLVRLFNLADEIEKAVEYIEGIQGDLTLKDIHTLKKEYGNFIRTAPYSVNEVLLSLEIPKKARDIITSFWFNFGIDCDKLNFTHFIYILNSYLKYGSSAPNMTSAEISNKLSGCIKESNSVIRYNSPVSRILVENNKANGVILKSGERLYGDNIICTCSPTIAYSKMIKSKNLPSTAVKRTNARTFGPRGATIYLGLNKSPADLGINEFITYISDINDTSKQYELMKDIETNNAFTAVCPNLANPNCSPQGTAILRFDTFYTDNCWANISPEQYFNEKDMLAARFIANFEERTGIIIHNNIEELEVSTPITLARFLGSPQGVSYGYYADDWDNLIARIMTEKTDNDIENLSFCGSWGTQLSGVSAAISTGRNAAFSILNNDEEDNK